MGGGGSLSRKSAEFFAVPTTEHVTKIHFSIQIGSFLQLANVSTNYFFNKPGIFHVLFSTGEARVMKERQPPCSAVGGSCEEGYCEGQIAAGFSCPSPFEMCCVYY